MSAMKYKAYLLIDSGIRECAATINEFDFYIGNDGAGVHISSALNKSTVSIMAAADPVKFGPWSEKSLVFYDKVDCFPCYNEYCKKDSVECIENVRWEDVFNKIKEKFFNL